MLWNQAIITSYYEPDEKKITEIEEEYGTIKEAFTITALKSYNRSLEYRCVIVYFQHRDNANLFYTDQKELILTQNGSTQLPDDSESYTFLRYDVNTDVIEFIEIFQHNKIVIWGDSPLVEVLSEHF